jgi:outer membrane lipoprotein SlyB
MLHKTAKPLAIVIALIGSTVLTGCVTAQSKSANVYDASSSGTVNSVAFGRVADVRRVALDKSDGTSRGIGTAIGGAVGAVAGSQVAKKGSGWNTIGGTIGAAAGAIGAESATRAMQTVDGLEITVRLEDKRVVSVTQEADLEIRPGQCVKLTSSNQGVRVAPANGCV